MAGTLQDDIHLQAAAGGGLGRYAGEPFELPHLSVTSEEEPEAIRHRIAAAVAQHGACVVTPHDLRPESLMKIARALGTVQSHVRADAEGLVGERDSIDQTWKDYRSAYIGVSTEALAPHTDGSFLCGVTLHEGTLRPVSPSALILLQCMQAAYSGGDHIITDGARVIEDLLETDPDAVLDLMRPGCMAIIRDDQMSSVPPVITRTPDGRVHIRFRYDAATYAPAWAQRALEAFHVRTMLPGFCTTLPQRPGEILVIDNHRALHGRESFVNDPSGAKRTIRRVWILREEDSLDPVLGSTATNRSVDTYNRYGPVGAVTASIPTGIQLNANHQHLFDEVSNKL
jgi:alpha-ketoglutarate-dependent taurine dioxygenase